MLFAGAAMEKEPSVPVTVAVFVFLTVTVTPGRGDPSRLSVTVPFTIDCAQRSGEAHTNPNRRSTIFLM